MLGGDHWTVCCVEVKRELQGRGDCTMYQKGETVSLLMERGGGGRC